MPNLASTEPQLSPDLMRYQLLQLSGDPVNVGPGGVVTLVTVSLWEELGFVVLDGTDSPTPTQYASPSQKFVAQSLEMAGFHARNCAREMPNLPATVSQLSPDLTRYHLLQFAGEPVKVGPGGVESWARPRPKPHAAMATSPKRRFKSILAFFNCVRRQNEEK